MQEEVKDLIFKYRREGKGLEKAVNDIIKIVSDSLDKNTNNVILTITKCSIKELKVGDRFTFSRKTGWLSVPWIPNVTSHVDILSYTFNVFTAKTIHYLDGLVYYSDRVDPITDADYHFYKVGY